MSSEPHRQVRRRRVFYVPGYDPFHPRRYRELYRRESAAQAEISGYEIALRPAPAGARVYGWQVEARVGGQKTHADVDVLVWSDIVRDSMSTSIPATYVQLIRTAWTYMGTGALWRLMRLRKGPVIAALYPVGFLLGQLALAVLFGLVIANLLSALVLEPALNRIMQAAPEPAPLARFEWLAGLASAIAWLSAGAGMVFVLRWFKARDARFFAYYLMHDYAHAASLRGAYPPELAARIATFADAIASALQEEADEVLVVGHSSGAYLAVSVLADVIRSGRVRADGPALGFLSLGQVVPMVSFLPQAGRLRADLRFLSARDDLTWVDVTAPGDGCAFALCDPVSVSGVAPQDKRWPLVFSAAFTQSLSPPRWKALRWRFFRLHFQYLCAFDQPKDYDYFQITAGPLTLSDRYAGRPPSRSRIDHAVSKYTSLSP